MYLVLALLKVALVNFTLNEYMMMKCSCGFWAVEHSLKVIFPSVHQLVMCPCKSPICHLYLLALHSLACEFLYNPVQ